MGSSSSKDGVGHIKRVAYACVGVGFICLGVFRQTIDGNPTPAWKRVLGIVSGLFFLYIASTYYFPKNRRRRAELDALLDEAEAAERRQMKRD
jgi:hypothetical protein